MDGLSIAAAPIIQYGSLDINYNDFTGSSVGAGVAQDFGVGFDVGATYDFSNGLVLGAVYKSKIDMDYTDQLSVATQSFVDFGIFPAAMGNNLEQPAEIGVGIAYTMDQHTFAFDYKQTQWSKAKGYKDFDWDD